jgi:EpsI family protein
MSPRRLFVVAAVLVGGLFAMRNLRPANTLVANRPLHEFPSVIATWQSEDLPFDYQVARAIGADDYTNREYSGGGRPIEVYIGYYKNQRSGEAIHSPRNCLPGEGWQPIRSALLQIGSAETPVFVNEYIVEKGARRDLVLYWYQTHGRIIASEYLAKFWLVVDGVRHRRTDGTLVRLWTTAEDGEISA